MFTLTALLRNPTSALNGTGRLHCVMTSLVLSEAHRDVATRRVTARTGRQPSKLLPTRTVRQPSASKSSCTSNQSGMSGW